MATWQRQVEFTHTHTHTSVLCTAVLQLGAKPPSSLINTSNQNIMNREISHIFVVVVSSLANLIRGTCSPKFQFPIDKHKYQHMYNLKDWYHRSQFLHTYIYIMLGCAEIVHYWSWVNITSTIKTTPLEWCAYLLAAALSLLFLLYAQQCQAHYFACIL